MEDTCACSILQMPSFIPGQFFIKKSLLYSFQVPVVAIPETESLSCFLLELWSVTMVFVSNLSNAIITLNSSCSITRQFCEREEENEFRSTFPGKPGGTTEQHVKTAPCFWSAPHTINKMACAKTFLESARYDPACFAELRVSHVCVQWIAKIFQWSAQAIMYIWYYITATSLHSRLKLHPKKQHCKYWFCFLTS